MAYEIPGKTITLVASTDLSAHQWHFVSSTGSLANHAGDGVPVLGVLQNKPSEGQAATIMLDGVSKVYAAGSTLAAGDLCASDSSGRAVPVAAGEYAVGRVIEGSSGSTGRILTVALQPVGTT